MEFHFFSHWRSADLRFIGFLLLSLAVIGAYLVTGSARLEPSGESWRRIDIERVQQLMESGELSGREAQWFHPTLPQERSDGFGSKGPESRW